MLGLILIITTLMMGYNVLGGIVWYLVFCGAGLVTLYFTGVSAGEIKFVSKVFVTRLVTSLTILILLVLSTRSVATYHFQVGSGHSTQYYSIGLLFSDFAGALDKIDYQGPTSVHIRENIINIISNQRGNLIMAEVKKADFTFALIMVVVIGLLIASFTTGAFRNLNPEPKAKSPTLLLIWIAVVFEIVSLFMLINIINNYNYYFLEVQPDLIYINIGIGFIIFMAVTLALAIYLTLTYKNQNRIA
jgi:hypothetical protein